jgi:hypothetical protein
METSLVNDIVVNLNGTLAARMGTAGAAVANAPSLIGVSDRPPTTKHDDQRHKAQQASTEEG